MGNPLAVTFTGLRFENPFLCLGAATESDSNIMRPSTPDGAGWSPRPRPPSVVKWRPKTKFLRAGATPASLDEEASGWRSIRRGTGS